MCDNFNTHLTITNCLTDHESFLQSHKATFTMSVFTVQFSVLVYVFYISTFTQVNNNVIVLLLHVFKNVLIYLFIYLTTVL